MKIFILISFLVLSYITFAYKIPNLHNETERVKTKRSEISDECKYINYSLWKKDESYNCCDYYGITCENGHITKL